jgi:hypothetical protein
MCNRNDAVVERWSELITTESYGLHGNHTESAQKVQAAQVILSPTVVVISVWFPFNFRGRLW